MEMDELHVRRALSGEIEEDFQRGNASVVRYAYLNNQVESLEQELALRKEDALKRGLNPRNRAEECGTRWYEAEGL